MSGRKDWDLKVLANEPIIIDGITIYSPLLSNIAKLGNEMYQQYLSIALINKKSVEGDLPEDITDFDILLHLISRDINLAKTYLDALEFFTTLKFEIRILENEPILIAEVKDDHADEEKGKAYIIHKENYSTIVKAIMFTNGIKIENDSLQDDLDDEVKKFLMKTQKFEKAFAEKKAKNNPIGLKDMVSTVANITGNGLNVINIWQINKYTLLEQLTRGSAKEEYERNLQLLLNGADNKKVKLEHYLKEIEI